MGLDVLQAGVDDFKGLARGVRETLAGSLADLLDEGLALGFLFALGLGFNTYGDGTTVI